MSQFNIKHTQITNTYYSIALLRAFVSWYCDSTNLSL